MAKPADKEGGQSRTEAPHDFLEQYLTFDPIDAEDSVFLTRPGSTLPVRSLGESEPSDGPSKFWEDEAGQSDIAHQSEPERLNNSAFCPDPKGYTSMSEGGSNSAQALLSLKGITLHSPEDLSPPSSPKAPAAESFRGRRRTPKKRSIVRLREPSNSHQRRSSPIRKATCPPKMMHPSCYGENIHDLGQELALGKFDFGFHDTSVPLSPPPSARISDSSDRNSNMVSISQPQNEDISWDRRLQQHFTSRNQGNIDSPLITPPADVANFSQSTFHHACDDDMIFASPRNQSSLWIQDPFNSITFDSSTTYVSEEESAPLLWSHASTVPLVQPSPNAYHRHSSHNNKSLAMELQAELAYNANELALSPSSMPSGLMIQMPESTGQKSFIGNSSPGGNQPHPYYAPLAAASSQPLRNAHRHTQSQPPSLSQNNEFFALPRHRRDKSHSRTESVSPPSPRTRSNSFHVAKQRRSISKKRGDQAGPVKTPKSATNANAMHDFVNFTPNDRKKILTGVAPSGSSKTKARREKEAMEKSRRLSQAAVRAVKAVGGSIEGLVEEGLFEPQNVN